MYLRTASAGKVKVKVGGTEVASEADFRYVSITSFYPMVARASETIMIHGTGFATYYPAIGPGFSIDVNFTGTSCKASPVKIFGSTATEVIVPSCAKSGPISVKVFPNEGEEEPNYKAYTVEVPGFVLKEPRDVIINSFSPAVAVRTRVVTITGAGFARGASSDVRKNKVTFGNDARGEVLSAGEKNGVGTLRVRVPAEAESGKISVEVNSQTAESPAEIEIISPTVDDFTPKVFRPNFPVTITGTYFAEITQAADPPNLPAVHANEVCFGDKCLNFSVVTVNDKGTELRVNAPSNIPEGMGTLKVKVRGLEIEASEQYTVRPAVDFTFTGFDPSSARMGETFTVMGTGFHPDIYADIGGIGTPGRSPFFDINDDQTEAKVRISPNIRGRESDDLTIVLVKCSSVAGCVSQERKELSGFSVPVTPEFTIEDFSPNPAIPGEVITITGTGFSLYAPDSKVLFGKPRGFRGIVGERAHEVNADGTELKVRLYPEARSGKITVFDLHSASLEEHRTISTKDFTVQKDAPTITGFSPASGGPGTEVTITGSGFSPNAEYNEVSFAYGRGVPKFVIADWVNEEGTELKATIGNSPFPTEANGDPITVPQRIGVRIVAGERSLDNDAGRSAERFELNNKSSTEPEVEVSSFMPTEGLPGDEVTITGTNFSTTPAENTVTFGGKVKATPSAATATSLTVSAPYGARTGPISVAVRGEGTGTSTGDFTVSNPVVSSFMPEEGGPGAEVTITGAGFSTTPADITVVFGRADTATPTAATATSLTVTVPEHARTGRISVIIGELTGTSSKNFKVPGTKVPKLIPLVTFFKPTSGKPGIPVTITGFYFSKNKKDNIVKFGGEKATVDAVTTGAIDMIKTSVPTFARTGRITVTVDGETGTSEENFTVPGTEPVPPPRPSGILNVPGAEGVHVYPNPASQEVRLTNLPAAHAYSIYSLAGKVALTGAVRSSAAIDVSGLARGQYVLSVAGRRWQRDAAHPAVAIEVDGRAGCNSSV